MLSIFNDERRGHAPFLSDPARDGALFDRGHGGVIIIIRP